MPLVARLRWLILLCVLSSPAAASVCVPEGARERLGVELADVEMSTLEASRLDSVHLAVKAFRARLWLSADEQGSVADRQTLRLVHDYRAYDIPSMARPLETNGHLHRLGLEYRVERGPWQWAVSPLLAASSNVGRHPKEIDRDTVAWHAAVRRTHRLGPNAAAFWGACRDDRLGTLRLLPVIGVDWHVDRLRFTVGYPESGLTWRAHPRWTLQAGVHPAGGSWRAYSDDLQRRSRFRQSGWRYGIALTFEATASHRLTATVEREVRRKFRFRLEDGTDIRAPAAPAWALGIRLQWIG